MGRGIMGIVKFILGMLLLPLVVAVTIGFRQEVFILSKLYLWFVWGVLAYAVCHLFVYTPRSLYQSGQKVFGDVFNLFPSASTVIPLVFPLFPTIVLILFYLSSAIFKIGGDQYFMAMLGFTLALHVILTAHDLYEEDTNPFKPRYLFTMCLVYVGNLLIVAILLDVCIPKFSFFSFLEQSIEGAEKLYGIFFDRIR